MVTEKKNHFDELKVDPYFSRKNKKIGEVFPKNITVQFINYCKLNKCDKQYNTMT